MDLPEVMFDLAARRNLFLAVKEALNNAAKYSQANELFLRIHCDKQTVHVKVEDNGRGFDVNRRDPERDGNGLKNMAERMKQVGGEFRIWSENGKGSRLEFYVPLIHMRRRTTWS